MIQSYTDYLCCSKCKADLLEFDAYLLCQNCKERFEIKEGIPIMIESGDLSDQLRGQIRYVENEKVADSYRLEEWQKSYLERFIGNFSEVDGRLIIDCGTGSGYMAIELAKLGGRIIAFDLTLKNLIRLKRNAATLGLLGNVMIVCGNAVLEHLAKEQEAIWEINRVCKVDAGLMITTPLKYKYLNPLSIPVNCVHDKKIGHLRRYDDQTLVRKFTGWQKLKCYYTGHTTKVFKILVNFVSKVFDETKIEKKDRIKEDRKYGASNIIVFFRRMF